MSGKKRKHSKNEILEISFKGFSLKAKDPSINTIIITVLTYTFLLLMWKL